MGFSGFVFRRHDRVPRTVFHVDCERDSEFVNWHSTDSDRVTATTNDDRNDYRYRVQSIFVSSVASNCNSNDYWLLYQYPKFHLQLITTTVVYWLIGWFDLVLCLLRGGCFVIYRYLYFLFQISGVQRYMLYAPIAPIPITNTSLPITPSKSQKRCLSHDGQHGK